MTELSEIRRRTVLAFAAGLLLETAGCTSAPPQAARRTHPGPSAGQGSPTAGRRAAPVRLPVVTWHPDHGDLRPEVKLLAARTVEAIGTWPRGAAGVEGAVARLSRRRWQPGLAAQVPRLTHPATAASVTVIEAQYGGLLPDRASVLVVCAQSRLVGDRVVHGGTTVDVRLSRAVRGWVVTRLRPAHPGPPRPPSRLVRRVLTNDRIDLPPASVADLLSDHVHDSVLLAMLRLAERFTIGVSVVRSGHPIYVFGTTRLSDHPKGRAFDTFRIDSRLVADPETPRGLVTGYMRAAADAGSYNVGGPYQLGGRDDQFFSDPTHHDHVHAGFRI